MAEKSNKTTKQQELTAQDAFQLYGAEASDWLMKRQQALGIGLGVLIVGGLIAATVNYFATRGEDKASKQLGQALAVLERPVVAGGAELQPVEEGQEPPFKSDKEKDDAIVKSLSDFRAQNKGADAAVMAALPLGKAEYRLGNYDGALAAFDEYVGKGRKDELMVAAREGQGYAHEAKGQLPEALASFQEMAKLDAGGFLQGMGQYHQARILVAQGKPDEAAQLLADLKVSQASSAAGRLATERLAVLAAQGVKIPEPKAAPAASPDAG